MTVKITEVTLYRQVFERLCQRYPHDQELMWLSEIIDGLAEPKDSDKSYPRKVRQK